MASAEQPASTLLPASAAQPVVEGIGNDDANHISKIALRTEAAFVDLSVADLVDDANKWACSFCRDFRALHQLNHNHDCTSTCVKHTKQKAKDIAHDALRLGKVVACRFFFFHIVVLKAAASLISFAARGGNA